MRFAQIARELREDTGLSQQRLADKLGLSSSGIARWELGQSEPGSQALITYSKYFGVSVDYLLGLEDDFGARTATVPAPMGESLTAQERELVELFRGLSDYLKGLTLNTMRGWASGAGAGNGLHKKA